MQVCCLSQLDDYIAYVPVSIVCRLQIARMQTSKHSVRLRTSRWPGALLQDTI